MKRLGFAKKTNNATTNDKKKNSGKRKQTNLNEDDRFVTLEFVVPHDLSGSQELTIYLISDGYLGLDQQCTFKYCAA